MTAYHDLHSHLEIGIDSMVGICPVQTNVADHDTDHVYHRICWLVQKATTSSVRTWKANDFAQSNKLSRSTWVHPSLDQASPLSLYVFARSMTKRKRKMRIETMTDYLCFYVVVLCHVSLHFADATAQFAQMFASVLDVNRWSCVLSLLAHHTVVSLVAVRVRCLYVWTMYYASPYDQPQLSPPCCVLG